MFHIETFCIFPSRAIGRNWLTELSGEGVGYGFIPRKRNIIWVVHSVLRDYNPLIFHTHFFMFDLAAIVMKLSLYRQSKVVWHYHNPAENTFKQQLKDIVKIRLLFNCLGDRCIAVGDGVYKSMINSGLASRKAVLVHNGVNVRRLLEDRHGDHTETVRASLGIGKQQRVFILLGWDPIRKGVDVFCKAAQKFWINNHGDGIFIVIGRKETKEFVSALPDSATSRADIRVIEPMEDLSLLLNCVDVLVSASRNEGLSYAVLEAMAVGKLILSSDIPSVRQTYANSAGVWLFPTEDASSLSFLMEKAATLPTSQMASLGKANSRYVLENHSLTQWTEKVGQTYAELLHT